MSGMSVLESVISQLDQFDYAMFVYGPDDLLGGNGRNERVLTARDNVILEHGMFLSRLGRERVFFLVPRLNQGERMRIPSDLDGVLYEHYIPADKTRRSRQSPDVRSFCTSVSRRIRELEQEWTEHRVVCAVWEDTSIAHTRGRNGGSRMSYVPVNRIEYGPASTRLRICERTREVRLDFDLSSRIAPGPGNGRWRRVGGPATARGRLHGHWAYAIYSWQDTRTKERIVGVCVIKPSPNGMVAYWLSEDRLGNNADAMILGAAVSR